MSDFDLQQVLFEELGYTDNAGIQEVRQWNIPRRVPTVDYVCIIRDIQLAYFRRFEYVDEEEIRQLHRAVWSESKTPLLYIILPTEIRIYNGYAPPSPTVETLSDGNRLLRILKNLTDVSRARQQIQKQLYQNHYDRIYLETGAFWDTSDGRLINKATRADNQLLRELAV
ncbi:MAG: hypothetical protein ABI700_01875, partial [Chloroflexota bacterium]